MRLPITMSCNNIEALIRAASQGLGLAYLPDFAVRQQMISGELQAALNEHTTAIGIFSIVWPSSRYLLPKVRVFIDFICEHILFSTEN